MFNKIILTLTVLACANLNAMEVDADPSPAHNDLAFDLDAILDQRTPMSEEHLAEFLNALAPPENAHGGGILAAPVNDAVPAMPQPMVAARLDNRANDNLARFKNWQIRLSDNLTNRFRPDLYVAKGRRGKAANMVEEVDKIFAPLERWLSTNPKVVKDQHLEALCKFRLFLMFGYAVKSFAQTPYIIPFCLGAGINYDDFLSFAENYPEMLFEAVIELNDHYCFNPFVTFFKDVNMRFKADKGNFQQGKAVRAIELADYYEIGIGTLKHTNKAQKFIRDKFCHLINLKLAPADKQHRPSRKRRRVHAEEAIQPVVFNQVNNIQPGAVLHNEQNHVGVQNPVKLIGDLPAMPPLVPPLAPIPAHARPAVVARPQYDLYPLIPRDIVPPALLRHNAILPPQNPQWDGQLCQPIQAPLQNLFTISQARHQGSWIFSRQGAKFFGSPSDARSATPEELSQVDTILFALAECKDVISYHNYTIAKEAIELVKVAIRDNAIICQELFCKFVSGKQYLEYSREPKIILHADALDMPIETKNFSVFEALVRAFNVAKELGRIDDFFINAFYPPGHNTVCLDSMQRGLIDYVDIKHEESRRQTATVVKTPASAMDFFRTIMAVVNDLRATAILRALGDKSYNAFIHEAMPPIERDKEEEELPLKELRRITAIADEAFATLRTEVIRITLARLLRLQFDVSESQVAEKVEELGIF